MRSSRNSSKKRRGYILLEAMTGGALVAVVIAIVFAQIADARQEVSYNSRHAIASSLARGRAAELAGSNTLAASGLSAFAAVDAVNYPGMQIRTEVIDATATAGASNPPITATLFEIRVDVRVPIKRGGFDIITYRTMQKD